MEFHASSICASVRDCSDRRRMPARKAAVEMLPDSNQWAVRNRFRYKGLEVEDFFDRIYLSFELHMQKPDKEIFKYVLEDAGIAPEETFFIDDSVANCSAAEQLGIRTYCCPAGSDWRFLFEKDGAS